MDLRHLRTFGAVMRHGSTVGAARALGISQPSVSRLLAELEAHLGRPLFVRANGRLVARESADALLPEVERALAGVESVFSGASGEARPLRIAAPAGIVSRVFGPAVRRLRDQVPGLSVHAEILSYTDTLDAVAAGRIDLGFVKAPVTHPAVAAHDLVVVGTDVVMPEGHRLSRRTDVTVEDLRGEPLVLLGRHRPFRVELEDQFAAAGITPEVSVETHAVSAACSFVREGLGVTIANALLARAEVGAGLVTRPFRSRIAHRFCLIHARGSVRVRVLSAFVACVHEVAAEILTPGA
jgi:DNA-binding transcriptional LysR family regulator